MASFAPAEHLSHSHEQHVSSLNESVTRAFERIASVVRRWAAAHHQRVQDRMFWELALRDPRVMGEIQAIRDRSQPQDIARGY